MISTRWWDAAALAAAVVVAGIAAIAAGRTTDVVGAGAAAAAFLLVYFSYARRFVQREDARNGTVITVLFAVILAAGVAFEPAFATLQAFIYPYLWATAASTRRAIGNNIIIGVAVVVGYTIRFGVDGLLVGLLVSAISVAFSMALGLWITRIATYGEERARLLADLESTQDELAALHRDAGVSSERERLAREIHDTIAQSLTGLVMLAERAGGELAAGDDDRASQTIGLIESMARDSLTEARSLVAAITPVRMESTLAEAIGRLVARFERETGVRMSAEVASAGLAREVEVVLLRCAQEGLANVRKHARASSASVSIGADADEVVLVVADDGVGLDADAEAGFGLAGMRERLALVGGSLQISADHGTRLTVRVPRVPAHSAGESRS